MGSSPVRVTSKKESICSPFLLCVTPCGKDDEPIGFARAVENGDALREVSACGVSEIPVRVTFFAVCDTVREW